MKFLSIDIESTGLEEQSFMIEFAMIPFDTESKTLAHELSHSTLIQCPSFEELSPNLDPWVRDHMKDLIVKAHGEGIPLKKFKEFFKSYLESEEVKKYFNDEKIVLFGKSLNAIDLPFMNRDLGWNFVRKYFQHRVHDLSSISYALIDLGHLPKGSESGSKLMAQLNMGDVAHTALKDAENTAIMYLKLLEKFHA